MKPTTTVSHRSPKDGLLAAQPEHKLSPWKIQNTHLASQKSTVNQRLYFDWLGKEIGVKQLDDWYHTISCEIMKKNGGVAFLKQHNNSPSTALIAAYPEHNWLLWKFKSVPKGYWKEASNLRSFFDDLGKRIGIQTLDDWYHKLSFDLVTQNGGGGLLNRKKSPSAALMDAYPEHNWIPWKFATVPQGYWKDPANQRRFFDELGKQLGIQELDDWYDKLSKKIIIDNNGISILSKHRGSPASALMAAYPEHTWAPWKFDTAPMGYWSSKDNINQFLSDLSDKLLIQSLDDWYRVDLEQLHKLGAGTILNRHKGLYGLLKEHYPDHPWDPKKFHQLVLKAQRWLAITLKKMFPNEEILEDYMHPKAPLESRQQLQLDVYIPSKSLAFEYQGKQHYEDVRIFSPTTTYQQRDKTKKDFCAANNIKLIEVPYWWNRTPESLQQMICV